MTLALRSLKHALMIAVPLSLLGFMSACGGSLTSATANTITRSVTLTGDQEVPAVQTAAIGTGSLTLDLDTLALSGSVVLDGVNATAAHVHSGAAGSNGALVVALTEAAAGTWSVPANTVLTASQASSFQAGALYINVHSAAHASGEIRGQVGMEVYSATLSGAQEVPPTASTAGGTGSVVLDPITRAISGSVTLSGMSATLAHIHTGAAGSNGGVAVGLTESLTSGGTWVIPANTVLTDAQVAGLRAGELYFNAHSAAFAGGEVRGQIHRKVRHATLHGGQEVPATASSATASGFLSVDPFNRAVSGSITVTGTSPTAAHVHLGAYGANGAVQFALVQDGPGSSTWSVPGNTVLSAVQYQAFLDGMLYFNVHSTTFASGEIRGQIDDDPHP